MSGLSVELKQALLQGDFIITPNQPSALALLSACEFPCSRVFAFNPWLQDVWRHAVQTGDVRTPAVLEDFLVDYFWEQSLYHLLNKGALRDDDLRMPLLKHRKHLIYLAKDAYRKMIYYDMPPDSLLQYGLETEEDGLVSLQAGHLFVHWLKAYEALLQQHQVCDKTMLAREVLRLVKGGALVIKQKLCVVFGDAMPPVLQQLFRLLEQRGQPLSFVDRLLDQDVSAPVLTTYQAASREAELDMALMQAQAFLHLHPHARRVGIVLSDDSDELLGLTKRIVGRFFAAQAVDNENKPKVAVDFSALDRWIDQPLIDYLLRFVGVHQIGKDNVDSLIGLLTHSYLPGSHAELLDRLQFVHELKAWIDGLGYKVSWKSLKDRIPEMAMPYLQQVLNARMEFTHHHRLAAGLWFSRFVQLIPQLVAVQQLAPDEAVLFAVFIEAMEEIGQRLELILPIADTSTYIACINHYCSNRYLHEVSDTASSKNELNKSELNKHELSKLPAKLPDLLQRISFISPHEARHLAWDYLWLSGSDQPYWPVKSRINPLLPASLQIKYQVTRSSPALCWDYSIALLKDYSKHAPVITLSYIEQPASSLFMKGLGGCGDFADLPLLKQESAMAIYWQKRQRQFMALPDAWVNKAQEDAYAPEFSPSDTIKPGGSALLEYQSACPFKAFARFRLHIAPRDQANTCGFLSPLDKGNLLHQSMELVWQELSNQGLGSRTQLEHCAVERLEQIVFAKVQEAVDGLKFSVTEPSIAVTLAHVEKLRLTRLILLWLEQEKQGEDFTLKATEQVVSLHVNQLRLKLRIDRLDQLPDQSLRLIDYKTSTNLNKADWLRERPLSLQLILYALAKQDAGERVSKIAFAQLNRQHIRLIDLDRVEEHLPKWREQITGLVTEFIAGYAAVTPQNKSLCQYCDFSGLCRVE